MTFLSEARWIIDEFYKDIIKKSLQKFTFGLWNKINANFHFFQARIVYLIKQGLQIMI